MAIINLTPSEDNSISSNNNIVYETIIRNLKEEHDDITLSENEHNESSKWYYRILYFLISASFALGYIANTLKFFSIGDDRVVQILNILQTVLGTIIFFFVDTVVEKKASLVLLNGIKNSYGPVINEFLSKYALNNTTSILTDVENLRIFSNTIETIINTLDSSVNNENVKKIKSQRNLQRAQTISNTSPFP